MFTEEQQLIINTIKNYSGNKIIGVNAIAGSGKSTTAKGIIQAVQPKNGLYTAFNKSVIEEAKKKITGIDIRTMHSLAYKYTNYKNIGDLTVSSLSDIPASYKTKKQTVDKINNFFVSKYTSFNEYCKYNNHDITNLDIIVLQRLNNQELASPFNFLLKVFHNALVKQSIDYPEYDLIVLDECQDTSAVALEIFKLLKAKRKVVLGDTHQNIYNFMNTVNAFKELNDDEIEIYNLTQSFRCNNEVAEQVELFGKTYFNESFKFKGTSNPPEKDNSIVTLTRTNGVLLRIIEYAIKNNIDFKLYRNPYNIADFYISLILISLNREEKLTPVQKAKYRFILDIYKEYILEANPATPYGFYDYLLEKTEGDEEIEATIGTIKQFNKEQVDIFKLVKQAKEKNNPKAKLSISTVHTFKGLEADTVFIHDSLNRSLQKAIDRLESLKDGKREQTIKENPIIFVEPFNIYYVALSRARYKIENFSSVEELSCLI